MPLRNWILPALLPLFAGCGGGSPAPPPAVDATVSIDNTDAAVLAAPPVNRRLLGSNLEWIGGGDDILTAGTSTFATAPLGNAATLAPAVIRYPGGSLADAYQWLPGVATPRGQEVNIYSGQPETVYFGTSEFLSLCRQVGASPLITLNVVTAAPSDSAAWVAYTNGSPPSGSAPVVPDWEVGNEPYYLNGIGSAYTVTAAQYAAAYDAHVSAVRAADPRVRVGLCLAGAIDAPLLSSGRLTWNADVLGAITQRVDFVAIHDAYLPVLYNYSSANPPTSQQLLSAMLASAPAADADLSCAAYWSTAPPPAICWCAWPA